MINKLTLLCGFKNGRSFLQDVYFTPPFRVVGINEYKEQSSVSAMVMSSSPGILDGDQYEIDITVQQFSAFLMYTQAYQRLFQMKNGASQNQRIILEVGASFSYVPHPVVPHASSIFTSNTIVKMADNCNLTLGEIITCGRKLSGELFHFTHFQNITCIYHNAKLLLKDNILIRPKDMEINTLGQMEGFTHQATLMHVNTSVAQQENLATFIESVLESEEDVTTAYSQPNEKVTIVRVLGNGGEQLFDILTKIQRFIWEGVSKPKTVNELEEIALQMNNSVLVEKLV